MTPSIYADLVEKLGDPLSPRPGPEPRHALDDTQAFDVPREVFTKEQSND